MFICADVNENSTVDESSVFERHLSVLDCHCSDTLSYWKSLKLRYERTRRLPVAREREENRREVKCGRSNIYLFSLFARIQFRFIESNGTLRFLSLSPSAMESCEEIEGTTKTNGVGVMTQTDGLFLRSRRSVDVCHSIDDQWQRLVLISDQ